MWRPLFICVLVFIIPLSSKADLQNSLAGHSSAYLAMHGQDPVAWQQWNVDTVARAKRENKLLFVSSGYFSCHWCHVMQRESYQNKAIAALLNKYFIPVKVDREIHAALDSRLIEFVEKTQGYSGWPLNVFVSPEGYPLVGMVYVPPENFKQLLEKLQEQWQAQSAELKKLARQASDELARVNMAKRPNLSKVLAREFEQSFLHQNYTLADEMQGGFGQQNKFPSVPQLMVLLDIYQRHPKPRLKNFLELTLNQMASLGLRDHLGGGFFRYAVDPGWMIPHFEKMLYDNALLAELYLDAGKVFNNKLYKSIGFETLDFMLRDMATDKGGLAASLSAVDDKGIEGGYYLWEHAELKKILTGDELAVANLVWQLEGPPDIEHGHHLVQAGNADLIAKLLKKNQALVLSLLENARVKMHKARAKRHVPKDSKRIAAWNALALSALVKGIKAGEKKKYFQAAKELRNDLMQQHWDGKSLARIVGKQGRLGKASLEDYAYLARGLLDWAKLTNSKDDWHAVEIIIKQTWQRFYTTSGWLLAEDMLLKYGEGQSTLADGPMPSASAVLINTSSQFLKHKNDNKLRTRIELALSSGHEDIKREPFWFASHIEQMLSSQ
ncbi:MAG: DUF255 domain-containing protein [Gammaproteobacteria bacterium]|nr:DUF255 domain-containing protein [Gammaproteobacteria bacterium]